TSLMAVELVESLPGSACAVLGSGAVGLATARLLQQRGARVTIYTRDLPPRTTSNIAGAQWWPTSVFDDDRITPEFRTQFLRAARLAYDQYQTLIGPRYGIRWLPNYFLNDRPFRDTFMMGTSSPMRGMYPGFRDLAANEHPFAAPHVRMFYTM